jgi:hypothetical protein
MNAHDLAYLACYGMYGLTFLGMVAATYIQRDRK